MTEFSIKLLLASLFLSITGAWIIDIVGQRLGLVDYPNGRSSHCQPTPRGGAIGIVASFVVAALFLKIPLSFWIPSAAVSLMSLFTDRFYFSVKFRLVFQFSAAIILIGGIHLSHLSQFSSALLFFAAAVFMVGTTNFYNFMDGINGIAAITGIVGFGLLALYTTIFNGFSAFTVMIICIAASCLGFLPFNFPKARVFMGDVGSIFLGFVFAGFVIEFSENFIDFVCLASFLFPFYADELTTMVLRIRERESITQPHRRHLYQLMANEYGIPHWQVSTGYGLLQLIVGLSVLLAKPHGSLAVLSLVAAYFAAFTLVSFLVRKKLTTSSLEV